MKHRIVMCLLLGMLRFPISAMGQTSPVLVLKNRIALANVKGRMDHLGVDLQGQRIFVTAFDNHTVEVIDLQTGRHVHTIGNLDEPQGAFYDVSSNHLFVTCGGDGTVRILDGGTFELLQVVKLSSDADNIRYDAHGDRVVVGYGGEKFLRGKVTRGKGDGALAILDSAGKLTGQIPVDAHPESFQLEKSGTRVFVNVPDHREVEVADVMKHSVLAQWPIATCTDNFPMTLDETDHRLFVGCRTPPRLLVFDTETGERVASYEGANSDDIFYDASKGRVYVLGRAVKSDAVGPAGPGFVDVFQQEDANHYRKMATYLTGPGAGTGFFVPEWGELFVAARREGHQSAEILVYQTK